MSYCLRLATKYPMPQGPNMFTAEEDDRKESESLWEGGKTILSGSQKKFSISVKSIVI
mgnify:CR=1 FL=1